MRIQTNQLDARSHSQSVKYQKLKNRIRENKRFLTVNMAHKMSTERGNRNERYTRTNRWTNKQRYSYEQTMSSQWDGNNAGIAQSKRQREKVKTRLWIHICSFNQKHYSHSYEWQSKFGERTNEQTKRMKKKQRTKEWNWQASIDFLSLIVVFRVIGWGKCPYNESIYANRKKTTAVYPQPSTKSMARKSHLNDLPRIIDTELAYKFNHSALYYRLMYSA